MRLLSARLVAALLSGLACALLTVPAQGAQDAKVFTEYDQCGGKGGSCNFFTCAEDAAFPNTQCISGLVCTRQSEWYWQCLPGTTSGLQSTSPNTGVVAESPSIQEGHATSPTPAPVTGTVPEIPATSPAPGVTTTSSPGHLTESPAPTVKVIIPLYGQCGGLSGSCGGALKCADAPFPAAVCALGSECIRQSEWYYQCTPAAVSLHAMHGVLLPWHCQIHV